VARNGRHVELLGHYNPQTEPSTVEIDTERAQKWLQQGAQPSDRVRKLLKIAGLEI
jgi:small subunit ribosomal protein S16